MISIKKELYTKRCQDPDCKGWNTPYLYHEKACGYCDKQLFVPNIFTEIHQKLMSQSEKYCVNDDCRTTEVFSNKYTFCPHCKHELFLKKKEEPIGRTRFADPEDIQSCTSH